jgi:endonuclease YncB( thermonuclease family)
MGLCFSNQINLNEINTDSIPYFSWDNKTFDAIPCNIYDGDTFSICWISNGQIIKYRCRCLGYDSPEMKPLLSNPNRDKEKELALAAKNRLIELLGKAPNKLVKIKCGQFDKYGRILVTVWNQVDKKSINEIMIEEGHGKVYDGKKKESWI